MEHLENSDSAHYFSRFEPSDQNKGKQTENSGFFSRIFSAFASPKQEAEKQRQHKISLLRQDADSLSSELEKIKLELHEKKDKDLSPMVPEIIDPLLREVQRIQRVFQEGTLEECRAWTKKAKLWVQLYSQKTDKKKIKQAIVEHVVKKSLELVDRDIKCIQDYIHHYIEQNDHVSAGEIQKAAVPFIKKLHDLKTAPSKKTLEGVNQWRESLVKSRDKQYHCALTAIEKGSKS